MFYSEGEYTSSGVGARGTPSWVSVWTIDEESSPGMEVGGGEAAATGAGSSRAFALPLAARVLTPSEGGKAV